MIKKASKGREGSTHDKVYTPYEVARKIIYSFPIEQGQTVLEPCRGQGAFYNNFPAFCNKKWCEIDDGVDFFDFTEKVDWIITNPPYSIFDEFAKHCFEVADNVVFLAPAMKMTSSFSRLKMYSDFGCPKRITFIGASKCGFPFGFPCAIVWWQKDYKGPTYFDMF